MVSQNYAVQGAGYESRAFDRTAVVNSQLVLIAAIAAALALSSGAAHAATITVNSLADPGAQGICVLRDAITAANSRTQVNLCNAGSGNDTIRFSVTGTIQLANSDPLPEITDSHLTINGPITIDGSFAFDTNLAIASTATVKLKYLTIENADCCAGSGNAISNEGTLTIANSTVTRGRYAIFNGGSLTISNSTFAGNAGDDGFGPSAIGNYAGTLKVTNTTFSGNVDWVVENRSQATITDSTFSGNFLKGIAALYNDQDGSLIVINSTFADNLSQTSAAAITNDGRLTVIGSTFSSNASQGVGALENTGSLTLRNSIVANSTDASSTPVDNCLGTITDNGYNISDDDSCGFSGTSRNNTDPGLSSHGLTNNGGPTQTIALAGNSRAIDVIPLAQCTDQSGNRLKTDQRGFPRPDAGENVCDIGAFETQDGLFSKSVGQ